MLFVLCYAGFAALSLPSSQQMTYYVQTKSYPGRTTVELSYSVTACVVGLVCGPLLIAPWAKVVGRSSLILWCLTGAFFCQVWASQMTHTTHYIPFILSRTVAGLFASVPTILGPSYAVQMFFLHQRGKIFTTFELSFLLGVTISPTVSGFIVENHPWPTGFYWTLAPAGSAILLVFFLLEETGGYGPSAVGDRAYPAKAGSYWRNRVDTFFPGTKVVPKTSFKEIGHYAKKPFIIGFSPITIIAGGYIFVCFSFVILANILLTIFLQSPVSEGGYGFSSLRNAEFSLVGWAAILVAQLTGWALGDRVPLHASRRFGHGTWRPEYRLWNILLPGLVAPIALGLFGAAVQYHLHYMVLAVGFFLIVFSSMLAVPICLNYIVECFMADAMEATIAMNAWRLSFAIATGFIFGPWEHKVGVGWLFGMAAFADLVVLAAVGALVWKGEALRRWSGIRDSDEEGRVVMGKDIGLEGRADDREAGVTSIAVVPEAKV